MSSQPSEDCTALGFSGEGRCIEPAVRDGLCAEHAIRHTPYDCATEGHVPGPWYIRNRSTKYRSCVIPGCRFVQNREVNG